LLPVRLPTASLTLPFDFSIFPAMMHHPSWL
jgi:hypothetical protein